MREVILLDGRKIQLKEYQARHGLAANWISRNFSVAEFSCGGELLVAEPVILFAQALRDKLGRPVKANRVYATQAAQNRLLADPRYQAAKNSPHVRGMAMDVDTTSKQETAQVLAVIKQVVSSLGFSARFGWKQYQARGQTFIHVDFCPMYYAKGKVFHGKEHPAIWERGGLEW